MAVVTGCGPSDNNATQPVTTTTTAPASPSTSAGENPSDGGADSTAASSSSAGSESSSEGGTSSSSSGSSGPCPSDMALVADTCMDRFEAPNIEGALPLVMFHYDEARAWCEDRDKRLCFDDEWRTACEGPNADAYPYGPELVAGQCNDEEIWRVYEQGLLNQWPLTLATTGVESLDELFAIAEADGGAAAVEHVAALYQAEPSGSNPGCARDGVFDLVGNVEEWTVRRDGGEPSFHGDLRGRYWADPATCQTSVTVHGDFFRFYEIGFRCCVDPGA